MTVIHKFSTILLMFRDRYTTWKAGIREISVI